jgi:tetratricopeptide (TPR) repeat protein
MPSAKLDKMSAIPVNACVALAALWLIVLFAKSDKADYLFSRAGRHLASGHTLHNEGDQDGAIRAYTEAIRINPNIYDGWAYYSRGNVHFEKGDLESAILDYTEAIKVGPTEPKYYYGRSNAYEAKGDMASAKADRARAMEIRNRR